MYDKNFHHLRPYFGNVTNWYIGQQTKIQNLIESFLELNENQSKSQSIEKMHTMFEACMNTSKK